MKNLNYDQLSIQPYLVMNEFSSEEKKLLFSLRSQCYDAKTNFRKINRGDIKCRLQCDSEESQTHIFQSCKAIFEKLDIIEAPNMNNIYGTPMEQLSAIKIFVQIDMVRKQFIKDNLLPLGVVNM